MGQSRRRTRKWMKKSAGLMTWTGVSHPIANVTSTRTNPNRIDPAFIQKNIESTAAIGGLYDFVALAIERDHDTLLQPYRLATGARSVLVLLEERDSSHTHTPTHQQKATQNA